MSFRFLRSSGDDKLLIHDHGDPVRHLISAIHIIGDGNDRRSVFLFELKNQINNPPRSDRIQTRSRIVIKNDLWPQSQRPGDSQALLHSPADLVRVKIARVRDRHRLEEEFHPALDFLLIKIRRLPEGKCNILPTGQRIKKRILLKEHADAAKNRKTLGAI